MLEKIFIIIPAWNEEKKIGTVIDELKQHNYSIVVVDDGSQDNTFEIAKSKNVFVLQHKINRGQGASLQTGNDFALKNGAEILVHFDGDGQFLVEEIEYLLKPILSQQADIVLGSRFINRRLTTNDKQQKKQMPFLKKFLILPVARIINYLFTGVKLTDAHCGLRAMNRNAAEKIKITQDEMSHNTDIVSQIKKNKLKYQEIPITIIYHEFGQNVDGGFKILKELFLGWFVK